MLFSFGIPRRTLAYLKNRQDWKKCLFLFHLCTAVVGRGKCLKVSNQIIRYFSFQFVYQAGPRPTLMSTICKVNISFLFVFEVKLFDRSHRHVVLKQEEKLQTLAIE